MKYLDFLSLISLFLAKVPMYDATEVEVPGIINPSTSMNSTLGL